MTAGMFVQIAKKVDEVVKNSRAEYKTMIGNKTASIHPASVLFQKKPFPEAIIYTISIDSFQHETFLTPRSLYSQPRTIIGE